MRPGEDRPVQRWKHSLPSPPKSPRKSSSARKPISSPSHAIDHTETSTVSHCSNRKRARRSDWTNLDEEEHPAPKKRRLQMHLMTSTLSRPYASPSTYIPARRAPRDGPWSRQRIAGRDLLRKAAVFNRIAVKRRSSGMRGVDHRKLTRQAALIESYPKESISSPVTAANKYPDSRQPSISKADDFEDHDDYEPFDAFQSTDNSDEEDSEVEHPVYSDLNFLSTDEHEDNTESADELYSFDSFDTGQTLVLYEGEKTVNFLREMQKNSEVSLAPFCFSSCQV